jgi:AraC-like DNA-binding protein
MSGLIVQAGLYLGLPVILLLFFFSKKNSRNNLFLALSLFSIWYALLLNYLNRTELILQYPYLIRTGNTTTYLILPFLYFYTRNTFYPGVFWRKRDWLFFLPAIIYCIDLAPFFFSDSAYKIAVMKENLDNPRHMLLISEGWIKITGFHFIFRYLWGLFMMILQIRLVIRNWNFEPKGSVSENYRLFWFIFIVTACYVPLLVPGIFGVLLNLKWYTHFFNGMSLSIMLLITTIYILFSPQILYGFLPQALTTKEPERQGDIEHAKIEISTVDAGNNRELTPKSYLNPGEVAEIIEKIDRFMEEKKPYLHHGYTIHSLSEDIGIPVYQLSPIINHQFQSNFSSWINKFRINYFIGLCSNADKRGFTFDALSAESGFSNRATFIKAFKKEKGTTPGIFLKDAFHDDDTVVHL